MTVHVENPSSRLSTRAEREAEARRLRDHGLMFREIAERMGVAISTVDAWINDPGGRRMRARKLSYAGSCVDCGEPTNGYDGPGKAHIRCHACDIQRRHDERIWTREAIIECVQAWARESGGIPPSATDWNPYQAVKIGHPEKAEKFHADDAWPNISIVQREFGSWNAAIAAAGFQPRRPSSYGRDGDDPDLCSEIAGRYAAGESSCDLAHEYGCSTGAIAHRVMSAGGQMRTHSEAWALRRERAA